MERIECTLATIMDCTPFEVIAPAGVFIIMMVFAAGIARVLFLDSRAGK